MLHISRESLERELSARSRPKLEYLKFETFINEYSREERLRDWEDYNYAPNGEDTDDCKGSTSVTKAIEGGELNREEMPGKAFEAVPNLIHLHGCKSVLYKFPIYRQLHHWHYHKNQTLLHKLPNFLQLNRKHKHRHKPLLLLWVLVCSELSEKRPNG